MSFNNPSGDPGSNVIPFPAETSTLSVEQILNFLREGAFELAAKKRRSIQGVIELSANHRYISGIQRLVAERTADTPSAVECDEIIRIIKEFGEGIGFETEIRKIFAHYLRLGKVSGALRIQNDLASEMSFEGEIKEGFMFHLNRGDVLNAKLIKETYGESIRFIGCPGYEEKIRKLVLKGIRSGQLALVKILCEHLSERLDLTADILAGWNEIHADIEKEGYWAYAIQILQELKPYIHAARVEPMEKAGWKDVI